MFEDDLWDFTDVVGLPVQMALYRRRFDFTTITNQRWRLIAKELILALLAPNHNAVVRLPRAYRTPLHLTSCYNRLYEAGKFFGWLDQRGITALTELDTHLCEQYLAFRRYVIDPDGVIVGEQSPGVRRAAAQMIVDLVDYRDLFTADRVPAGSAALGRRNSIRGRRMPSGRDGEQDPARSCRSPAADAGRGPAPGADPRSACCRAERADPQDRPCLGYRSPRASSRLLGDGQRHHDAAGRPPGERHTAADARRT